MDFWTSHGQWRRRESPGMKRKLNDRLEPQGHLLASSQPGLEEENQDPADFGLAQNCQLSEILDNTGVNLLIAKRKKHLFFFLFGFCDLIISRIKSSWILSTSNLSVFYYSRPITATWKPSSKSTVEGLGRQMSWWSAYLASMGTWVGSQNPHFFKS